MTDQPRPLCIVCFRQHPEPGKRKCPDCDFVHQPHEQRASKKPRLDLSQGLPEDLSGYSIEDFAP